MSKSSWLSLTSTVSLRSHRLMDEPQREDHEPKLTVIAFKFRSYFGHAPGFWNNLKFLTHMSTILHREEPSEYLTTVFELVDLINKLQPDICILDPLFDAAADSVAYCQRKSVKLVPMDARYAAPEAQGADILKQPS